MPAPESHGKHPTARGRFASTHWSVVLAAAQTDSPEAEDALERLCLDYWYPLYAYLRRSNHTPQAAEDLTQEFFARSVVTKKIFQGIHPGGGRFRSWLLCSLQNMVRNERDKENAAKRGGGQLHFSLDFQSAEDRYVIDSLHELTPEKIYERSWALNLIEVATQQLKENYRREGKAEQFEELKKFLPGEDSTRSQAEVAARLGKSEAAVKMAISRFRQEFGRILKAEVGRVVAQPAEIEDELHHLLGALGSA